jgi:TolA-binding protein
MKRIVLISLFSLLYANEPSVYGAGDMDSAEPYGLTSIERSVLQNRKSLQTLRNRVAEQQNRIDGLTTVIEGLNKEILALKEQQEITAKKNKSHNPEKTYNMLLELGKMIDQINNNYVTQEDLKESLSTIRPVQQYGAISSSDESSSVDISSVYRRGVQLFGQKSYQSAKQNFEDALAQNYQSASSNYHLGEIAYYTQEYDDAISYFKKSASLDNKASYMKILYLHTALALSKTGQESQAKGFFQFIIDTYPYTKVAEIAKNNL